mgnify:CR=1 FL=1
MSEKKRSEKYPTVYITKSESYIIDEADIVNTRVNIIVCNNFINSSMDYCLLGENETRTIEGSLMFSERVSKFFVSYINNIKSGLPSSERKKITIEFNDKLLGKLDLKEYDHFNDEKKRSSLHIPFTSCEARFFMEAFASIKA